MTSTSFTKIMEKLPKRGREAHTWFELGKDSVNGGAEVVQKVLLDFWDFCHIETYSVHKGKCNKIEKQS